MVWPGRSRVPLNVCRWNCPPGWPPPPPRWRPDRDWTPDPEWEPAPEGWQFWTPLDRDPASPAGRWFAPVLVKVPARRILLVLGFAVLMGCLTPPILERLIPDPGDVHIDDLNRSIDPKQAIRDQCAASVAKVGHLAHPVYISIGGIDFQRWEVTPTPGHVDRVLLNTKTGQVLCP